MGNSSSLPAHPVSIAMGNYSSLPAIPAHPDGTEMKAVCFSGKGGAELLEVKSVPKPSVDKPSEILIKVHAAALNPIDKLRVAGKIAMIHPEQHSTSVLGYDASGVVEEVGADVEDFKVGDEVYVRLSGMKWGSLAEYVVCKTLELAKKPASISHVQAAAVPLAGLTALQALRKAGVTKGSKVFVTAGSGGVGSLAIQIAKKVLGASYVATTASPGRGTEICQQAGADKVVNYREEKFEEALAGENFDAVFDTTGEDAKVCPILAKGGRVVSIVGNPTTECLTEMQDGVPPNPIVRFFLWMGRNTDAEFAASSAGGSWEFMFMRPLGEDLATLAKYLEDGSIKTFVDVEASSLDDFKVAVDKMYSGRAKGKCVIKVV